MHNNSLSFQSPKLSGIGRQLDQLDNSNDPDRACKVNPIKKYYISKYFSLHFQFYFTYIGITSSLAKMVSCLQELLAPRTRNSRKNPFVLWEDA